MATRRETLERREKLAAELRESHRSGLLRAGQIVPSQRELADKYQLSMTIVGQELHKLIDEGVFYSVPRIGTFAGPREAAHFERGGDRELYLLMGETGMGHHMLDQIRLGFEDRITSLGGAVSMMGSAQIAACRETGQFPRAAGSFDFSHLFEDESGTTERLARVCYGRLGEWRGGSDTLSFDDFDGGQQATRHLLANRHTRLAFVGLHIPDADVELREIDSWLYWSQKRCEGWKAALEAANLPGDAVFLPTVCNEEVGSESFNSEEVRRCEAASRTFVQALRAGEEFDGVVAANDTVARTILRELKNSRIKHERWPAIVGFDSDPTLRDQLLTSLRLPWEEMGRAAAQMLWDRRHGRLPEEPQHKWVPMRLIARLSCRNQWHQEANFHGALTR